MKRLQLRYSSIYGRYEFKKIDTSEDAYGVYSGNVRIANVYIEDVEFRFAEDHLFNASALKELIETAKVISNYYRLITKLKTNQNA